MDAAALTDLTTEEAWAVAVSAADLIAEVTVDWSSRSADAGASDSDAAAIEFSPCCASVAPSASGSDCVTSSLAHLFCSAKTFERRQATRRTDGLRVVIDRGLADMDIDGEEKARKATRRRQSLDRRG